MPFPPQVVEDLLVKSARCCCLCRQFKGQKIEVHHIVPEADGGPSTEDNGIPLCFDCHADVQSYNDKHPKGRKYRPAEVKRLRDEWFKLVADGKTGGQGAAVLQDNDAELVRFYSQCFDRPAFQDEIRQEGHMEDFDKAMEDTITAINTGCLRARDGQVLSSGKGKSHLENKELRETMDTIVDILRAIRSRYDLAKRQGQLTFGSEQSNGMRFYYFHHEVSEWIDHSRSEVIGLFSKSCDELGLPGLHFPRNRWRH